MASRYLTWLKKFEGKKITTDLEERSLRDQDLQLSEWNGIVTITMETLYRPYRGCSLATGLHIIQDQEGLIRKLDITADVYGEDGLGDVNPNEVWKEDDYLAAKAWLEDITK